MKSKVYADTNLFIRFFTDEPAVQAQKSKRFLGEVSKGKYNLFICDLVIAEIDNAVIENRSIILRALDLYEEKNIDFTDAYLASHSIKNNCNTVATFDEDFKKIDPIKEIIP